MWYKFKYKNSNGQLGEHKFLFSQNDEDKALGLDQDKDENQNTGQKDQNTPTHTTETTEQTLINNLDNTKIQREENNSVETLEEKPEDEEIQLNESLQQMTELKAQNPDLEIDEIKPKNGQPVAISAKNLSFYYGDKKVLKDIDLDIPKNQVMALIGPSGCGKSTFLRCLNRMNEFIDNTQLSGKINLGEQDIYDKTTDVNALRRKIGMINQKPNPMPMSIYDNIAYGLRLQGITNYDELKTRVENALIEVGLWEEVKDRIHQSALQLSGGQQQRLCIARAIAVNPEILLMDEPCSALDPVSTKAVEQLIQKLKNKFTIVIVTHNMQQAQRVSDQTAMFFEGRVEEAAPTKQFFANPKSNIAQDYLLGYFS